MRRECRERFPRHCGLAIPTCITARAGRTCRDACRDRWLVVSFEVGVGENAPGIPGKRPMSWWRKHPKQQQPYWCPRLPEYSDFSTWRINYVHYINQCHNTQRGLYGRLGSCYQQVRCCLRMLWWKFRLISTIWLPVRWASGFSGDHQQDHQCLWFLSCYYVTHAFCPRCLYSVGNKITTNTSQLYLHLTAAFETGWPVLAKSPGTLGVILRDSIPR